VEVEAGKYEIEQKWMVKILKMIKEMDKMERRFK